MNIESPIQFKTIRRFNAAMISAADADRECLLAGNFYPSTLYGGSYVISVVPVPVSSIKEQPETFVISGRIDSDEWQLELPVKACLDLMQDIEPLLMPTDPATIAEAARCFIRDLASNNLPSDLQSTFTVSAATKAALPGANRWPFRVQLDHRSMIAVMATSENLDLLMKKYVAGIKKNHSDIKNKIASDARIQIATYRTTRSSVETIEAGDVILIDNLSWNACSIVANDYIQMDCRIDARNIVVASIAAKDLDTDHWIGASKITNSFISFEEADDMQDDPWNIAERDAMPDRNYNRGGPRDRLRKNRDHNAFGQIDAGKAQVEIVFDAGRVSLPLSALETIAPGYVFKLENIELGTVSMLIAGKHIGKAEIVDVDAKVGFRILEIIK